MSHATHIISDDRPQSQSGGKKNKQINNNII